MYKSVWLLKNSNRSDAIIEFLDYVYSSLYIDKKQSTIAVYLDFAKALHTVNRDISMSKLLHNDIRGVVQSWFKSYLSYRKQYNYLSQKLQFLYVKHFIRFSTILGVGPSIFYFCISKTCIDPQKRWALFIFLTIQYFLHSTVLLINSVHATVNREIVGIDNWLKTNRLSLN